MRRWAALGVSVAVFAATAVVASLVTPTDDGATPASSGQMGEIELLSALEPFDGCDDLLQYFKSNALERVGPWGLEGHPYFVPGVLESADSATVAGQRGATADSTAAGEGEFSTTNVQEAGVDEPDLVKTDGERLVVLAGEDLHVLTIDDGALERRGTLRVGAAGEMLLAGDRVLVFGHGHGVGPIPLSEPGVDRAIMPVPGAGVTELTLVDISDVDEPREVATLSLDGTYVSARMVDGVARVVVRSQPVDLDFRPPEGAGLRAEREATRRNREVIRESTIDQWLPYAVVERAGGDAAEQSLLECSQVHHPDTFGGFGTVSVLSVELGDTLTPTASAAVIGDAETVYATADYLYVALTQWGEETGAVDLPEPGTGWTAIHQFDIADPAAARYVASGTVEGRLLNQWALSEHDGHLRVATTRESVAEASESAVEILRERGGELRRVGVVDGLGRTEQIYAVRYAGPVAYVVTFRQVDPLYTLDLSDPTTPRTRGELKVRGYSSYLHPVADDTLLGVGQDARASGEVLGSQVSLFDVSDLDRPRRVDQLRLGRGSSPVEHDHRAFLHWPATGTVVLPLDRWERRPFSGVVVLDVDDQSVRKRGEISHDVTSPGGRRPGGPDVVPYVIGIHRSLVVGDALVTVSPGGVMAHDLETLERQAWVPLT